MPNNIVGDESKMKKSEGDLLLISPTLFSLQKSKGSRNGLVQQIITYVRDGRTVTRKQWVRSEFAEHARKNEDEKKQTILKQQEKEQKKHKKQVSDSAEKAAIEDRKIKRKLDHRKRELEEKIHGSPNKAKTAKEELLYIRKLKKLKEKNKDTKDKKDNEYKDHKGETRGEYGKSDKTKNDNQKLN